MGEFMLNEKPESTSPNSAWYAYVEDGAGNVYKVKLSNLGGGLPALSTPTLTATVISSTQIDLSWTNVANESSYMLEWSPNGTSGWTQIGGTIAANTVTYSHTSLTASTLYYYRVKAVGDGVTYTDSGYGTDSDTTSAGATTEFVVWADPTANVTTGADGAIEFTAVTQTLGARATKKLNGSWNIEMKMNAAVADSELAYLYLSGVNNTDFTHGGGANACIAGMAVYQGDIYLVLDDAANAPTLVSSDTVTDDDWVRFEKSSDNLLIYTSTDGINYTLRHTETGQLTGVTDVFIKMMNGGATNGVAKVQGIGLTTI